MFPHILPVLLAIFSLLGPSNAGNSDQYNEIGIANVIPPIVSVGYQCQLYCRLPMNIASITCRLNATLLPTTPLTPLNKGWSHFNPYCWCLSPYIMNYTPRCIWCLRTFSLLPDTVDLLTSAFSLCVNKPLSIPACPLDCGALKQYEAAVVTPCVAGLRAQGVQQQVVEKRCWCTKTVKGLVDTCHFCLQGYDKAGADAISAPLSVCGGVFTAEAKPKTTKAAVGGGPQSQTIVTAVVTHAISASKREERVAEPTSLPVSAGHVDMSKVRGGPAEGYYESVPSAAAEVDDRTSSEAVSVSPLWWVSVIGFELVLLSILYIAGVFKI